MGLQHYTQDMSRIPLKCHTKLFFYTKYTHPTLICRGTDTRTDAQTENIYSIFRVPQLRRAPIKFGRFIKLNNINVKVLYKQANIGFAAEAVFLGGGERGRFAQKKGVTLLLWAITDF